MRRVHHDNATVFRVAFPGQPNHCVPVACAFALTDARDVASLADAARLAGAVRMNLTASGQRAIYTYHPQWRKPL